MTGTGAAQGDEYAPGDTVGDYRIRSLLAVGGMGKVYRAVGAHGEEVALKLLKLDIARDDIVRRRFEREARIAQRIVHPNVVPVLDVGEHNGIPYMAQTFVRGGTLADKIQAEGPLSLAAAVTMCLQVAGGLDAIHVVGLVHRDVKPANILLDEQGVSFITDFGLAKDSQQSALTRPGQALGSLDYMSPEQIRTDTVGPATDVYGLGCVMCAAMSGSPPYADRHGMSVLWAHLQEEAPDPTEGRKDVPAGVGAAILTALRKEPAERPQTASEYAQAVALAAGIPV